MAADVRWAVGGMHAGHLHGSDRRRQVTGPLGDAPLGDKKTLNGEPWYRWPGESVRKWVRGAPVGAPVRGVRFHLRRRLLQTAQYPGDRFGARHGARHAVPPLLPNPDVRGRVQMTLVHPRFWSSLMAEVQTLSGVDDTAQHYRLLSTPAMMHSVVSPGDHHEERG
jgi:hypothetical protein